MSALTTIDSLSRRAEDEPGSPHTAAPQPPQQTPAGVAGTIKSFFHHNRVSHPLDEDTMLKYFLSQLDVRAKFVAPRIAGDAEKEALLSSVRTELSTFFERHADGHANVADDAWNQAYYLERLLALIEPADTLLGEVQRRLDEATDEKISAAPRLRAVFEAVAPQIVDTNQSPPTLKPNGESRLRAMLLDIMEEIHWNFQRKFHSRPIQKSTTRRLVWTGLAACALFILPYAYIYVRLCFSGTYVMPFHNWAWLPLWTAVTAGFFGAMFSRLLFLQANWNVLSLGALKDARDFTSIFLRGAVGMTGAVVVYYFLLSGVIGGGLFPQFKQIGLHQLEFNETPSVANSVPLRLILPNAQLALLVVWSFLAGFSERLVPSILQTTEASLGESVAQRKKT
jgi:hypothetical protein